MDAPTLSSKAERELRAASTKPRLPVADSAVMRGAMLTIQHLQDENDVLRAQLSAAGLRADVEEAA
jgi:hypothetical protein